MRHLIELLDGAVQDAYVEAGLDYRPRFTPVMRALAGGKPHTVSQIAEVAGITQPAATQTVNLMVKEGWLVAQSSPTDARQKLLVLSAQGKRLLPKLQACWRATAAAADDLDTELPHPLSDTLARAIEALERRPFGERIRKAKE
ncbi:MarR family winged helix-turn-helix transcriptional regulator [Pseudoduganella sp. OTU4001]|uniref:MarR family winged helix-turn-helix transcriptional regulator n=1 Tax=Pseudoduganella sp. OTU4001 TaxID=3043854 RepID=UPI00313D7D22